MTKIEWPSASERGSRLYETSEKASRMIIERITLENLGLSLVNLPLCDESEAEMIEEFIPRAKEGLSLSLQSSNVLPGEIIKLLRFTTPLAIGNQFNRLKLLEQENTLPEFRHTLAVFAYLLKMRKVSFYDFTDLPRGIDGDLGAVETAWNFNTFSIDHLWSQMTDIENLTRAALYQKEGMNLSDLFKVGHFFSASKEISRIFS